MKLAESLKINLLAKGIGISQEAREKLSNGGDRQFAIHEYTTTGGVNLILDNNIYINAPFDEPFFQEPDAVLKYDKVSEGFLVSYRNAEVAASILPLPGYLHTQDAKGRPVTATVFSHADRVRVSPIYGCTMSCEFCDIPGHKYVKRPLEQLLESLKIALDDPILPVFHVLISGGTPGPRDYEYFDNICAGIVSSNELDVDVMMPPRPNDPNFFVRLLDLGVYGISVNIEVYDNEIAKKIIREKHRIGLENYERSIGEAVQRSGGQGRVRSLVLVGLEPPEKTLEGVEFLARLGCDPVLSPFRPSSGTALADFPPPTVETLEKVYEKALEITDKYGVKLGPRCIPCQHNTLTFPDNSGKYYYSRNKAKKLLP